MPAVLSAPQRLIAAAILGLAVTPASGAGIGMSTIPVAMLVQPSAMVKFEVVPISISISMADIARGYIDIPVGSLLNVKSGQALPPVIIDFSMGDGAFKSVELREPETAKLEPLEGSRRTESGSDADTLESKKTTEVPEATESKKVADSDQVKKGAGVDRSTSPFAYRFKLSDKAKPGDYQVPLVLNITF
jgi:hypothetical protein